MKGRILIVAAHPDDEILGCAGTVARLVKEGCKAYTLVLGEGVTSRGKRSKDRNKKEEIKRLRSEAYKANAVIGVRDVFTYNFPDNMFDSVPLLEIVKTVEKVKDKVKPDIIFTNCRDDLNIDHRVTYEAAITAARPIPKETVMEIYAFEVLSSTEWNYPSTFSPDVFFDITTTIDTKLKAMRKYSSELNNPPHPRSLEGIKINAAHWGMRAGLKYAEAFKAVRLIK